jgi:hypothetical protein
MAAEYAESQTCETFVDINGQVTCDVNAIAAMIKRAVPG